MSNQKDSNVQPGFCIAQQPTKTKIHKLKTSEKPRKKSIMLWQPQTLKPQLF